MTGISNTIVVNLGGSNNDNNNEEDNMQKSLMNNASALHKEAIGNKDNNNEEDDGVNIIVNKEAALCKEAMKKNCKQETSAIKAMKIVEELHENGVGIGALVSLKFDYHTHCHAQGLLAIVYRFHTDAGGILVCCKHSIVTHDGSSNSYWVPYDKYRIIATHNSTFPISKKLQAVRDEVLEGNFVDDTGTPRISFSKYVDIDLVSASSVKKAKGCSCKRGCNKGCGCKKKGMRCHSGCACNGYCH